MRFSEETILIVNLIHYGSMVLGGLAIWFFARKDPEKYLPLKVIGYTILSAFRFSINWLHLPLGLAIAWFLRKRTKRNKSAKGWAMALGFALFVFSFAPIAPSIEQKLYPRNDINTYLHENIRDGSYGFNIEFLRSGSPFAFLTEKDETALRLYEALRESRNDMGAPSGYAPIQYEFYVRQDHPDNEFHILRFRTNEGRHLFLYVENEEHYFLASPQFERLFAEVVSGEPQHGGQSEH